MSVTPFSVLLLLLSSKSSGGTPSTPTSPTTPTLQVTSFPPAPVTTDSVRNKCRELLVAALQTDGEKMKHFKAKVGQKSFLEILGLIILLDGTRRVHD